MIRLPRKNQRLRLFIGLSWALLAIPLTATAADWFFVAWGGSGDSLVYVDKSSIERSSRTGLTAAWTWIVYKNDQLSEAGNYRSEKLKWSVDCDRQSALPTEGSYYSSAGSVVRRLSRTDPSTPTTAVLNTMLTFICSAGKQPFLTIPVYDPGKDAEQRFWLKERENRPGDLR